MLYLQSRLRETLRALADDGVPVMLLKGAAMGASVYQSFTDRPMADIDLLVRREHAAAASAAISRAGWAAQKDPARAKFYAQHHHMEPLLDGRGSGHRLELHTAPFRPPNPFGAAEADLWRDAGSAGADYSNALVPSRTHLFVYACVHLAWSHLMTKGAWRTFRDMSELAEGRLPLDWDDVVQVASRWKAVSSCYWSVRMAEEITGLVVPEVVFDKLYVPLAPSLGRALERHFLLQLAPGEMDGCPSATLATLLWRTALRPAWSGHGSALPTRKRAEWEPAPQPDSGATTIAERIRRTGRWLAFTMGMNGRAEGASSR
jgi:hypothetical protein